MAIFVDRPEPFSACDSLDHYGNISDKIKKNLTSGLRSRRCANKINYYSEHKGHFMTFKGSQCQPYLSTDQDLLTCDNETTRGTIQPSFENIGPVIPEECAKKKNEI